LIAGKWLYCEGFKGLRASFTIKKLKKLDLLMPASGISFVSIKKRCLLQSGHFIFKQLKPDPFKK